MAVSYKKLWKLLICLLYTSRCVSETDMQQSKHILDDFAELLADVAVIEKAAKLEGRNMSMVLTLSLIHI